MQNRYSGCDLNLSYVGGAGGFLLFHLLLLSGKYIVDFGNEQIVDVVNRQWDFTIGSPWRAKETWPDNLGTSKLHSDLHKIYYYCNPHKSKIDNFCDFNVCLYTDLLSQRHMAFFKKAQWYETENSFDLKYAAFRRVLKSWRQHYANVKDTSWPRCNSFRDIDKLPREIQQELLNNEHTQFYLNYQYNENSSEFRGETVSAFIAPYLNSADIVIKLQDLVNSNGEILKSALGLNEINDAQLNLITTWKKLHPVDLLNKVGINP